MECRPEEYLISILADAIGTVRHVAVGAASPIPAGAALLAQSEASARMHVTILHSRRHNRFTDGGVELFDCAGEHRIDVFFLGGIQIDGQANINLVGTGDYPTLERRFPGSFGSAYLYFTVPRVILFRNDHDRRTLVDKVDFVSAPGTSAPNVYRPGGPDVLITNLAVMRFDKQRRSFRLVTVHEGHTVEEVVERTGFRMDVPETVGVTEKPSEHRLSRLRNEIAPQLYDSYPEFTDRVFPRRPAA